MKLTFPLAPLFAKCFKNVDEHLHFEFNIHAYILHQHNDLLEDLKKKLGEKLQSKMA